MQQPLRTEQRCSVAASQQAHERQRASVTPCCFCAGPAPTVSAQQRTPCCCTTHLACAGCAGGAACAGSIPVPASPARAHCRRRAPAVLRAAGGGSRAATRAAGSILCAAQLGGLPRHHAAAAVWAGESLSSCRADALHWHAVCRRQAQAKRVGWSALCKEPPFLNTCMRRCRAWPPCCTRCLWAARWRCCAWSTCWPLAMTWQQGEAGVLWGMRQQAWLHARQRLALRTPCARRPQPGCPRPVCARGDPAAGELAALAAQQLLHVDFSLLEAALAAFGRHLRPSGAAAQWPGAAAAAASLRGAVAAAARQTDDCVRKPLLARWLLEGSPDR